MIDYGLKFRRLVSVLAGLGISCSAGAQAYPVKPIRMLVAQTTGGNADFVARSFAQRLAERFGHQIVVDNRPRAAGMIATEIGARAAPDGYTLLLVPTSHGIKPSLYPKMPYDPQRDLAPISLLAQSSAVVTVTAQLQARNVSELIALAKSRPGKLHFGKLTSDVPQRAIGRPVGAAWVAGTARPSRTAIGLERTGHSSC